MKAAAIILLCLLFWAALSVPVCLLLGKFIRAGARKECVDKGE